MVRQSTQKVIPRRTLLISTLTSKGQVTIPKAIRDYLGPRPGSPVEFEIDPNGKAIVHPAKNAGQHTTRSRAARLRGTLKARADTDSLMELLRNYSADVHDPGFGGATMEFATACCLISSSARTQRCRLGRC